MLDEPTAALGVAQTAQVLDLIRRLRERGLGVVVISHNLADVFEVADRIVVLRLGRSAWRRSTRSETTQRGGRRRDHRRRRPARRTRTPRRATRRRRPDAAAGERDRTSGRASRPTPRRGLLRPAASRRASSARCACCSCWLVIWIDLPDRRTTASSARSTSRTSSLQITAVGMISVGVVLVLLLGEIDLSVGAVSGLGAAVMAVLNVKHGWAPVPGDRARASRSARRSGCSTASSSRSFGIPSFVVTLAGLLAWQGALLLRARRHRHRQPQRPDDHRPRRHVLRRRRRLDRSSSVVVGCVRAVRLARARAAGAARGLAPPPSPARRARCASSRSARDRRGRRPCSTTAACRSPA